MRPADTFGLALAVTIAGCAPNKSATTRYRKGDYVTYRYSGSFSPTPVIQTERIEAQEALAKANESEVNSLRGLLPICAYCKKIRNDKNYWEQIEVYISSHTDALFSHGICPECITKHFPEHLKGTHKS